MVRRSARVKWIDPAGVPVEVTVVRKPVKAARLQVRPDGTIRIVAPRSFDVEPFLMRYAGWIGERRRDLDRQAETGRGNEDRLLLNGKYYRLIEGSRFRIDEEQETIACSSPRSLKRNLTEMLKSAVTADAARHTALAEGAIGRVTVRMQRTKWGSCSSSGNLNYNLRVIALPETLREYIVVHELAHLREHNHSRAYWDLVRRHYPGYRRAEEELKRYWVLLERNRVWDGLQAA
ncbi:hypothetical protein ABH15_04825 [Methanoculleus taiwanensis]|uniref:YgjP-like metallopeptidase domain-containing protein n=1 Tax=Methanoculleus taiwanensis TaxID=1550565 RepID=A0A498GYV2_9EURY|nr:hypothetical protein ABH15_04825 [Methanoculleus taiwanensis]